jgi:hypothetical protein
MPRELAEDGPRGSWPVHEDRGEGTMSKHHGANSGGGTRFSTGHILGLFGFYLVLAFCILAFTFFFVFTGGEYRLVIVLTLAFSAIATIVHVMAGRRSRVDTLIDKGS